MFGHPDQAVRDIALEIFVTMWTQVANHFQDYDLRLIFEPANEEWGNRFNDRTPFSPAGGVLTQSECYALITELGQVYVDLIRSLGGNNPDRFILIKGYNTDVMRTVDNRYNMPVDLKNRLLLGVHYYTPWSYCGDTSGVGHWGRTTEIEEMNHLLGLLTKYTDMGYGIVLGEWGVLDNEGDDRLTFFTNFLDNCDLYGYAPILWDTGYDPRFGGLFDRLVTHTIVAPEILELFQKRSVDARAGMSADEIITAARENMALTLRRADNRPETVISADEAFAWIMFASGDWAIQYSNSDRYRPDALPSGLVPTDVEVTAGAGTYTVALDFTGTPAGYANGIAFSAVGIVNGEILFPGYYIHITELLINGEQAEYAGIPYTTNDNPVTTRVNLYNVWVSTPADARVFEGDIADASPIFLEKYANTHIRTLEVTFEYIAP
jgi:endoglucanase